MAREHARALGVALETFARQWGVQLTAKLRVASEVTFGKVELQTYDEYAASLPATTVMVLCTVEGSSGKAIVHVPTPAVLSWIGRMIGATTPIPADARPLTAIEQALVRRLVDDALEDFRYCLGSLLTAELELDEIRFDSQFAQAGATTDLMVVSSFVLRVGDSETTATIALPAAAMLAVAAEADHLPPVPAASLIREQLSRVPVDVTVEFSASPVTPGLVLGLVVGDLIPLQHPRHRPLDVRVDGHPLARAAVGASGSRLAVVVVPTEERE